MYPENRKGSVEVTKEKEKKAGGLSARELLEAVYNLLKKDGREIKLSLKAVAKIADDSDGHRTRIGYTGYESAAILKVADREWILAFGTKCGQYPADPYNCDIVAMRANLDGKTDKEAEPEIHQALERNTCFHHSLAYAMADGTLALNQNGCFCDKVIELLRPKIEEFIARDLEVDPNCFTMDLRPVVKSAVQYKPEFIDFLRDTFLTVLASA